MVTQWLWRSSNVADKDWMTGLSFSDRCPGTFFSASVDAGARTDSCQLTRIHAQFSPRFGPIKNGAI
jgi:hypothetical protein